MLERRTVDWKLLNIRGSGKRSAPCPDSDEGEGGGPDIAATPLGALIGPRGGATEEGSLGAPSPKLTAAEEETFSDLEATLLDELDHS